MAPALLYVITHPDKSVSKERYHDWYDNEHLPARLTVPGVRSALRFKAPTEEKWLAYYDMDSEDVLKSKEYLALKEKASENERELIPKVNMDRRVYKQIMSIGEQAASPPKTLLVVEMTPYPSHEKEFHHWYDTCHIPQMADVPGWSRSRRYELVEPADEGVCKFLTLHEFDKYDALKEIGGHDRYGNVKWRNEVIEIVTARDRSIWEPYQPKNGPPGVHTVHHNDIQFNVRVDGKEDGPVIALANPLGSNLSVWDKIVEALAPQYRIIRHDQRGHGRTSQPTQNTSFSELADDLIAILKYLKVDKLHALIGVSMGAIVALDFGLRFPEKVGKIIPCDGHPCSTPDGKKAWDARVELIQTKGVEALADQTADRWFTPEWKKDPANATVFRTIRDMVARTPPSGFIANARAMDDYDYVTPAKGLKVPCLLVCGAQDPPLEGMKELAEVIPNAHLVEIDHCGHLPMVEQPQKLIEVIKSFL